MKYLDIFESFKVKEIIDKIDDIAAYLPTTTSRVETKFISRDFDTKKIMNEEQFKKSGLMVQHQYLRYYIFEFHELSKFFIAESDIINRTKSYDLNFFLINLNQRNRQCKIVFFEKEEWEKLDIEAATKNINKNEWDILLENDVKIDSSEFDVLYDDDDIMCIKPKTYRAAIRYSADAAWKAALKKNKDWIDKYMTPGSYYGEPIGTIVKLLIKR